MPWSFLAQQLRQFPVGEGTRARHLPRRVPPDSEDDCIHIRELELLARVGVPEQERAQPQRLTASITLWPTAGLEQLADQIDRTVDYAAVAQGVAVFAAKRGDHLIETLAAEIASDLLATFPLKRVRIELRKFILPNTKYVAVILTRVA